jgi:hypothetical protein
MTSKRSEPGLKFRATNWADPIYFVTRTPLPRFLPAGRYRACVRVWDAANNPALGCAAYRIR